MKVARASGALVASIVFASSAWAQGYGTAWSIEDSRKAAGIYGFEITPIQDGYTLSSGRVWYDAPGWQDWEKLHLQLDKEMRIVSLLYEAQQRGVQIRTEGKLDESKKRLRLERREGSLPAQLRTCSKDVCVREQALYRFLFEAGRQKVSGLRLECIDPINLKTGSTSISLNADSENNLKDLRVQDGASGEASRFVLLWNERDAADTRFQSYEETGDFQFRSIPLMEYRQATSSLSLSGFGENSGAADQVAKLLDRASSAKGEELSKLTLQLAQLGPDLVSVAENYREKPLDSIQKIVLGLALSRLDSADAKSALLSWMSSMSSYERIMTVRGIGAGEGGGGAPLLFSLLQKREWKMGAELCKALRLCELKIGRAKLFESLLAQLSQNSAQNSARNSAKNSAEEKDSSKLPLLSFANEEKWELSATIWLSVFKKLGDQDKVDFFSLLGRSKVGNEGRKRLLLEINALLEDESEELALRLEAAGSLGRLKAEEGIPVLIETLGDERLGQRSLTALQEITGLHFPLVPSRWESWWQEEQQRSESELALVLSRLEDESKEKRLAAIAELPKFTLGRSEIASALKGRLEDPETEVSAAARRLLEQLSQD